MDRSFSTAPSKSADYNVTSRSLQELFSAFLSFQVDIFCINIWRMWNQVLIKRECFNHDATRGPQNVKQNESLEIFQPRGHEGQQNGEDWETKWIPGSSLLVLTTDCSVDLKFENIIDNSGLRLRPKKREVWMIQLKRHSQNKSRAHKMAKQNWPRQTLLSKLYNDWKDLPLLLLCFFWDFWGLWSHVWNCFWFLHLKLKNKMEKEFET